MRAVTRAALIPLCLLLMAPLSGSGMTFTAFSFAGTVDVTGASDTVDCVIDVSGATGAGCVIESPSGKKYGAFSLAPVGTVYTATVTIPADAEAGTYTLTRAFASAVGGSVLTATGSEIATIPATITFTVTSTNADTTAPILQAFTITPTTLDQVAGGTVECSAAIDALDTSSPFDSFACLFHDPNGNTKDASGNPYGCASSSGSCSFTVPGGSTSGYWPLSKVIVRDEIGNSQTHLPADIVLINGDTAFFVGTPGVSLSCTRTTADGRGISGVSTWAVSATQTPLSNGIVSTWFRTSGNGGIFAIGTEALNTTPDTTDAAILVRFDASGVEAYDGNAWAKTNTFNFSANTWYQLTIDFDWVAETFSVDVASCTPIALVTTVIADAAFQTGAPTTGGLSRYGVYGAAVTAEATDTMWIPFSDIPECTPATGTPGAADGCGGIQ